MFGSIMSYRKISKLRKRSIRSCQIDYNSNCNKRLSKQGLVNVHLRNIQQLMIRVFKCLKGLYPSILYEIFMLKNILCIIRNLRDLDSQLPKILYCELETVTYNRPQLWQQLSEEIKKCNSLVNFN